MEIQSMADEEKGSDNSIYIKNCKTGIDQYKKRIVKSRESLSNSKMLNDLILTTDSSIDKKEKLIYEEKVWSSFEKLESTKRSAFEMENISIDVSKEIHNQNEKLTGIGNKVNELNSNITSSSGLLTRMLTRQNRNKAIIVIFSIGLTMTFLFILYAKLESKGSKE